VVHPPVEPKCAVCNGKHTSWSNAGKKGQEEQVQIKRALANRPGHHRTDTHMAGRVDNESGLSQATDRNFQFNFWDFRPPDTPNTTVPGIFKPASKQVAEVTN
jgi:hypothetical protein